MLWSDRSKYAATTVAAASALVGDRDNQRTVLTPTPPPVFHSIGPYTETGTGQAGRGLAPRPEFLMREHNDQGVLKTPTSELRRAGSNENYLFLRVKVRVRCMAGFGETLWLTGNHPAIGGWAPSQASQLKTSASLFPVWTVVLELPLGADEFWRETPITYKYFLCAKAGGTVRWEDSIPERVLTIPEEIWDDASASLAEGRARGDGLVWREIVIEDGTFNQLDKRYTAAPAGERAAGGGRELMVQGETCTVTFQLVVNTNYGEEVWVCGSDAALGMWLPTKGIQMKTSADAYPLWNGQVQLPMGRHVLYKYMVKSSAAHYSWEDRIPDRMLTVTGPAILNDGTFNQVLRPATFQALKAPAGLEPRARSAALSPPVAASGAMMPFGGGGSGALVLAEGDAGGAGGAASNALKVQTMMHQQLQDQLAELQRQRAIETAEIKALQATIRESSQHGGNLVDPVQAADAFAKMQKKLEALEKKRALVHAQAQQSTEALQQAQATCSQIEAAKQKVAAELERERSHMSQLEEALEQTQDALVHAQASAQRVQDVGQKKAETSEQLAARLRSQITELEERCDMERQRLESSKKESQAATAQERMLQAQLLDKQQEGMREEQEEQQRLVSIREMQAAIAEMEASAEERQRADAAGVKEAEASVATLKERLALSERDLTNKSLLIKECDADLARIQAEATAAQKTADELQQRVASLEKEEAAAEAEARDLELEKLKPPPPPAPYFSWAQAAESAGKKIAHLRATALDHDLVERKMAAKRQHASWRAARRGRWPKIEQMEKMVRGLEDKRDRLSLSLDMVHEHKAEMQEHFSQLESHMQEAYGGGVEEAEQIRGELEDTRRELVNSSSVAQAEFRKYKLQIQGYTESNQRLEQEALTTREQAEGLQALINQGRPPTDEELGELHDYIKALEKDQESLGEALEVQAEDMSVLEATLRAAREATEKVIADLQPTIEVMKAKMARAKTQRSEEEGKLAELVVGVEEATLRLRQERALLQRQELERQKQIEEHALCKLQVEQHNSTYIRGNELLLQLQEALASEQATLETAHVDLETERQLSMTSEKERDDAERSVRYKESQIRKVEMDERSIREKIASLGVDALLAEAASLTQKLAEETKGVELLKTDLAVVSEELSQAEANQTTAKAELKKAQENAQALYVVQEETKAKLAKLAAEIETCKAERPGVEKQAEQLQILADEVDKEFALHQERADEVVSRVKALRRQSRELEEEIATIQMQALNAAGGSRLVVADGTDLSTQAFSYPASQAITPVVPQVAIDVTPSTTMNISPPRGQNKLSATSPLLKTVDQIEETNHEVARWLENINLQV